MKAKKSWLKSSLPEVIPPVLPPTVKTRPWSPARWKAQELLRLRKQLLLADPNTAPLKRTWSPARWAAQLARIQKSREPSIRQQREAPLQKPNALHRKHVKFVKPDLASRLTAAAPYKLMKTYVQGFDRFLLAAQRLHMSGSSRGNARAAARQTVIPKQLRVPCRRRKRLKKNQQRLERIRGRKKQCYKLHSRSLTRARVTFFRELYTCRYWSNKQRCVRLPSLVYQEKFYRERLPAFTQGGWKYCQALFQQAFPYLQQAPLAHFRHYIKGIQNHVYAESLKKLYIKSTGRYRDNLANLLSSEAEKPPGRLPRSAANSLTEKTAWGDVPKTKLTTKPRKTTELSVLLDAKPLLGLDRWRRHYAIKFASPRTLGEVFLREQYSITFDELLSWKAHQLSLKQPRRYTSVEKSQKILKEDIARILPYCGSRVAMQALSVLWVPEIGRTVTLGGKSRDLRKAKRRARPRAHAAQTRTSTWQRPRKYARHETRSSRSRPPAARLPLLLPWTYNRFGKTRRLANFLAKVGRIALRTEKTAMITLSAHERVVYSSGETFDEKLNRGIMADLLTEVKHEFSQLPFSPETHGYVYGEQKQSIALRTGRYDRYKRRAVEHMFAQHFQALIYPELQEFEINPTERTPAVLEHLKQWVESALPSGTYIFVLCEDLRERNLHALYRGIQWDKAYLQLKTQGDVQLLNPKDGHVTATAMAAAFIMFLTGSFQTFHWHVDNTEPQAWPDVSEVFVARKFDFRESFVIFNISPDDVATDFRRRTMMKRVAAMELEEYKRSVEDWSVEQDGPLPAFIPDREDPTFIVADFDKTGLVLTPFTDEFVLQYLDCYEDWRKRKL